VGSGSIDNYAKARWKMISLHTSKLMMDKPALTVIRNTESSLSHIGYKSYSPSVRRWQTRDPVGIKDGRADAWIRIFPLRRKLPGILLENCLKSTNDTP
jgi:hypothetical protein